MLSVSSRRPCRKKEVCLYINMLDMNVTPYRTARGSYTRNAPSTRTSRPANATKAPSTAIEFLHTHTILQDELETARRPQPPATAAAAPAAAGLEVLHLAGARVVRAQQRRGDAAVGELLPQVPARGEERAAQGAGQDGVVGKGDGKLYMVRVGWMVLACIYRRGGKVNRRLNRITGRQAVESSTGEASCDKLLRHHLL